jgi:hypothetical protein
MKKENIESYWESNFPTCPPINYLLKIFYTDRWLRIHSLPDSKRYADTDTEWVTLFQTQNSILDDIFIEGEMIYLLTGVYSNLEITFPDNNLSDNAALKAFDFSALEKVDLYAMTKDYCEENTFYTPYCTEIFYKSSQYNDLLKSIANDEIRAFFLNPKSNIIFAPYDGGIDIIYSDKKTKDFYQTKYNHFTQQDNC